MFIGICTILLLASRVSVNVCWYLYHIVVGFYKYQYIFVGICTILLSASRVSVNVYWYLYHIVVGFYKYQHHASVSSDGQRQRFKDAVVLAVFGVGSILVLVFVSMSISIKRRAKAA